MAKKETKKRKKKARTPLKAKAVKKILLKRGVPNKSLGPVGYLLNGFPRAKPKL